MDPEPSNNGNDLLVDFPTTRRPSQAFHYESDENATQVNDSLSSPTLRPTRPARKQVHFSDVNELAHIAVPSPTEYHRRWYNAGDKNNFKRALARDVRKVTSLIRSSSFENVRAEVLVACVGIELFLSPDLARRTVDKRTRHLNGVLDEFARQERQGLMDDRRLGHLSERSSRWSRERAHELALGYWELIND
ncbi:hypothetical protein ACHAXS_009885 [Conticribra weissflogii]